MAEERNVSPQEILELWESAHFKLSDSLRSQFLRHPSIEFLSRYSAELISEAFNQERILKLGSAYQYVQSRSDVLRGINEQDNQGPLAPLSEDGDFLIFDSSGRFIVSNYHLLEPEREYPEGEVIKYEKLSREGTLCHLCGTKVENRRCNCYHT